MEDLNTERIKSILNYELPLFSDTHTISPELLRSYLLFRKLGTDLETQLDLFFAPFKLSTGRFLILLTLDCHQKSGLAPTVLAQKVGVTQATISGLISSLEKGQLIQKRTHEKDGRSYLIDLTPQGNELVQKLKGDFFQRINAILAPVKNDDVNSLNTKLLEIAAKLQNP
ncbi:MAG: MarR family winged helix-turn-helix transcriptional regulator [Bdellovibrionia bacterium]